MKLKIELVPKTSWGNNARKLLTQTQWRRISKAVREKNKCEICENPKQPFHCHEVWEYNMRTKIQTLVGLLCLCEKCHLVKHFGYAQVKGRDREAIKHLMEVNKCSLKRAQEHVFSSMNVWADRSTISWQINIDYAHKYLLTLDLLEEEI